MNLDIETALPPIPTLALTYVLPFKCLPTQAR